jgi:hypothetical protein
MTVENGDFRDLCTLSVFWDLRELSSLSVPDRNNHSPGTLPPVVLHYHVGICKLAASGNMLGQHLAR